MKFYSSSVITLLAAPMLMACQSTALDASSRGRSGEQMVEFAPATRRFLANQNATEDPMPTQTFFIPLPEESIFKDMFYQINPKKARPHIESLTSLSISTDNTWIWWDHWEDGYDLDVANPTLRKGSTEIWGDRNADNGCAPNVNPCTHANDKLMAGTSIVIQNAIPIPRKRNVLKYDGGDRIQASSPIAVTRGAYPRLPGSLLAGAVEVLETSQWGTEFEAPAGMDIGKAFQAFQFTALFFMAMKDETVVTLPNGATTTLNMGQASMVRVNQAHQIKSTKPIQVDLITGDVWSYYEMRWFSLLPAENWKKNYVTPVGDSYAKTKVLMYNPGPMDCKIVISYLDKGKKKSYAGTIKPKQSSLSYTIPDGSGAWIDGQTDQKFVALSMTDTEYYSSDGRVTAGQFYDWGFPVVPREHLTSQVLVGWGFACTNNDCQGQEDRSKVWISPIEDANIWVDFTNKGSDYKKIPAKALQSIKITDSDHDMSGAIIFATKAGTDFDGAGVDIAAAWGQDASVSYATQSISLDLGTVVLPFTTVRVSKLVDEALVKAGQTITYTIRVQNVGQKEIPAGQLRVKDVLDSHVTYVVGSTYFVSKATNNPDLTQIADNGATKFPLDEGGYLIPVQLPRRGATFDIIFKVTVNALNTLDTDTIINRGHLELPLSSPIPFEAMSKLDFAASVDIQNTVYLGTPADDGCGKAVENVKGKLQTDVTYCFKVTNNGGSHLGSVMIRNDDLGYSYSFGNGDIIAPGDSRLVKVPSNISKELVNLAIVVANPVFADGKDMTEARDVTAKDTSSVGVLAFDPKIKIENTVHRSSCGGTVNGVDELVVDIIDTPVIYCFKVTNVGDTLLKNAKVFNAELGFIDTPVETIASLAPGQTKTVSVTSAIKTDLRNIATVRATPSFNDGSEIPGAPIVTSQDDSKVQKLSPAAEIEIQNKVYLGNDGGAKCDTREAVEYVAGFDGADCTYCLKVINNGKTHLDKIVVTDAELDYTNAAVKPLAPTEFVMLSVPGKISKELKNFATVVANPCMADGRDIGDLKDVTDTDPSAVGKIEYDASITIENTVYLGHNGMDPCKTAAAKEHVVDFPNRPVTYCFTVKNTGNTTLDQIVITNPDLDFTDDSIGRLAPGASKIVPFASKIPGKLVNNATVTAQPVLDVVADDAADIPSPSSTKYTMVYVTGNPNCAALGFEYGFKLDCNPDDHTYNFKDGSQNGCPTVFTGDASTKAAAVTDASGFSVYVDNIGGNQITWKISASSGMDAVIMKAGTGANVYMYDSKATQGDDTTPLVTPIGGGGRPRAISHVEFCWNADSGSTQAAASAPAHPSHDLPPVTDSDDSSVGALDIKPEITIDNLVTRGIECSEAVEVVEGHYGDFVKYCFNVTNKGNAVLEAIKINNEKLGFTDTSIAKLGPGESKMISVGGTITKPLVNIAEVIATPSFALYGERPSVNATDPSQVLMTPFNPSVTIQNKVYLGHDDGQSCDTAVKIVADIHSTNVTYCFTVQNDGDTYLADVVIRNEEILVDNKPFEKDITLLPPGESVTVTVPGKILQDLVNNAYVTANPILEYGQDIPHHDDVTASDRSEVRKLVYEASVKIENTVYLGSGTDDANSCGTTVNQEPEYEYVEAKYGADVTYCFKVINTGETHLTEIVVGDKALHFFTAVDRTLSPGEHMLIVFPAIIDSSLMNYANVTARPIMEDGRAIPDASRVNWSDPSEVGRIMHAPKVEIENTVYLGGPTMDSGNECDSATERVEDHYGSNVIYCLKVKNTGDTHLTSIHVDDVELKFTDATTIELLGPGESALLTVPRKITGNLVNNATVTANPAMPDGKDIPDHDNVASNDPSEVSVVAHEPSINIRNSVVLGSDGSCDDAMDHVDDYPNSPVKYCVTVKNTGNSYLTDVVISNDKLTYPDPNIGTLQPGQTVSITIPATIDGNLTNVASVTGNPSLEDGTDIPGADNVSDDDSSSVGELTYSPKISIDNTVYIGTGTDDENQCGAARDYVEGIYDTIVTYCFVVENKGNTYLSGIVVKNDDLDYTNNSIGQLAPGDKVTLTLPSSIVGDLKNIADVTANPTKEDGTDIPDLNDVQSNDWSEVGKFDHVGGVKVENTVFVGVSGEEKCGTADAHEKVEGIFGTNVVYCFTIRNTGDTFLNEFVVNNEKLNYSNDTFPLKLAPGQNITMTVPGTITDDVINTVVVTANPVLKDGTDIPDLNRVSSDDPSEVVKLDLIADVTIDNTVVLGHDASSCDTATEYVEGVYKTPVMYCLNVTNTGETMLKDVKVVDEKISYSHSIGDLASGKSILLPVPREITESAGNSATVTGNPTLNDGTDIPDLDDVSATDPSEVIMKPYEASVNIENTVYLGIGTDDENQCGGAVEYVENYRGAGVTYCFTVTNTGLSYLNNIKITNQDLSFSDDDSIEKLAPGDSATVVFSTTIGANVIIDNGIDEPFRNNATVVANPSLENGDDIPLQDDVTDSDDSAVGKLDYSPSINITNTVYLGVDWGASCSKGVEKVTAQKGSDVIYCLNVTNIGDTHLGSVFVTNAALNFTDSSIGQLAPGESSLLAFPTTIESTFNNTASVTANPVLPSGVDIAGAENVTSSDPSEVATLISGDPKSGLKDPYAPPNDPEPQGCIQNKWEDAGNVGDLVCATKEVYLDSLQASQALTCVVGGSVTVTIDASIRIPSSKRDLGWYVATDGGDAQTGTCVVNGLQEPNQYTVTDANGATAGDVSWGTTDMGGGDGDECGDVFISGGGGTIDIPFVVETELPCTDENEDGILDFAVCFTWRTDSNNDCTFTTNIPGALTGGCYCTRYDVPNIEVTVPDSDPIAPCR